MIYFLILVGLILAGIYGYNLFIRSNQLLEEAESGIDVQLKRRHELIPNLVEIVKGYMSHEKNVLQEVTRLRTEAIGAKSLSEKANVENQLTNGIRSIFAIAENYPKLKAISQFTALHQTLVSIENDLQMARRYYNGTARNYNVLVKSFPANVVAKLFNFTERNFFEIETVTERALPKVDL